MYVKFTLCQCPVHPAAFLYQLRFDLQAALPYAQHLWRCLRESVVLLNINISWFGVHGQTQAIAWV